MYVSVLRSLLIFPAFAWLFLLADVRAGTPPQVPGTPVDPSTVLRGTEMANIGANAEIYVKGPKGEPIDRPAVVTLFRTGGQTYAQNTTRAGFVKFDHIARSEFTVQVVAPGYQTATKRFEVTGSAVTITLNLVPLEAEEAATSVGFYALPAKVQKDVGKALEDLRAKKPSDARKHLEAAQKAAPTSAEIEYLFSVYSSQVNDPLQAKAHWMKTLELNPKHLSALLEVGQDLLQKNNSAEAMPYLRRAAEAEPSSWRAHALLAEALVLQHQNDEAVKHAERAIQLGHERANTVQPLLARALAASGDRDEATKVMQAYVQAHPGDTAASKDLETLKNPQAADAPSDAVAAASEMAAMNKDATALPMPSKWMPPDVDEKVPPVEAGASCAVDDVVSKAAKPLIELISDVDRFAATESLTHESINKSGLASYPEKRKFDYVVSIQEVQHGYLNVEEYRASGRSPADFPDGVATNGLPALVLIFHPYNAANFEMTCEGLARWNGGLAWQVHFKQRADKPNTIKRYRIGADGPSYPVALKGRAWISADTYQIVRLETDLVAPVPQIRLVADHTAVEYGPVKFAKGNVNMWLPQSAEVYYDWKGRRIHRRHSFSNYMLFGVEDKQKISVPKVTEAHADVARDEAPKEKPQQ
jgi:tetratricopeptide (TPR) repeat protein